MKTKSIKRFITVALAATMVMGSAVTAFAEDTPGVSEGTGTYEGGEMQYPTLSVTLPTIPAGTYDYIADPNGLIAATSAAHYDGAQFTGTTGIFFKTTDGDAEADPVVKPTYTEKSKALSITNQNAQDIDVTIKLEQKTAGSEGVAYSDAATFETTDKDTKIYLAVTDGAASDPQVSALSASAAATLTTKVEGVSANYEPEWTEENGYEYALKEESELTDWNSCSYNLTGALNTNAAWADGITFPEIKVTWSYAEHSEAPAEAAPSISVTDYSYTSGSALEISVNLGGGDLAATGIDRITYVNSSGASTALSTDNWSFANGKITIAEAYITALAEGNVTRDYKVTFDDTAATQVVISLHP